MALFLSKSNYMVYNRLNGLLTLPLHDLSNKGLEIQQVPISYPGITAFLLSQFKRLVLVVLVYISYNTSNSQDRPKLIIGLNHICKIYKQMPSIVSELESVISKDFNHKNILCGGNQLVFYP